MVDGLSCFKQLELFWLFQLLGWLFKIFKKYYSG